MFILIVVGIITFFIISLFFIIRLVISLNKIILYQSKIKYEINDSAKFKFKTFGKKIFLSDLKNKETPYLIYCTEKWSVSNNNYIQNNNNNNYYYILDSGYFYYISNKKILIHIGNDSEIIFFDIIKYSNKVKIIK